MKKLELWVGLVLILVVILLTQIPKQDTPQEPYLVGVLIANDLRLEKVDALKGRLKEMGLLEGEDVVYLVENAQNDLSQLSTLGRKLLAEKPDVLVASGAVEALRLKELTAQEEHPTPIVFMGTLSPTVIGLVENSIHPGCNLTGLNNYHYELTPKRLELFHRLLPEITKVAVLGDTRVPFFEQTQVELMGAAKPLGLELATYTVTKAEEINEVLKEIHQFQAQGIVLLPGFFLESHTKEIVEEALKLQIPVFGVYPEDTEDGCLASYGTSNWSQGAQSAVMVYKVLHGQSPGEIPVEAPNQIIFSVNLQTSSKLGITPSQAILSLADEVVK